MERVKAVPVKNTAQAVGQKTGRLLQFGNFPSARGLILNSSRALPRDLHLGQKQQAFPGTASRTRQKSRASPGRNSEG